MDLYRGQNYGVFTGAEWLLHREDRSGWVQL
jgi:hypothetical protein